MKNKLSYTFVNSIEQIGPVLWQEFTLTTNPFCQYEFLHALETSESVGADTGWSPLHLVIYQNNHVICLVPLYKKFHSYGEYVFDFAWANTYKQYGLTYYPKLVSAIPFTPVTGPRIMHKPDCELAEVTKLVCRVINEKMQLDGLSSMHWLFVDLMTNKALQTQKQMARYTVQFQWFNRSYLDFDSFLATMNSRKRKSIRAERNKVAQAGITIERLTGDKLNAENMDFFYHCYQQTYLKRSGHTGYLTQAFFSTLFTTMHSNLMLVEARRGDEPIASTLFFYDDNQLYGRYWGAIEEVSQLHFECCYYQGIEFCIERGLAEFNPGTQGEHKILRGFEPIYCYSNHQLKEQAFHDAVGRFIEEEATRIEQYKQNATALLPFKKRE
ncbi:MAG: GNAT family N-acetyltransferase [Paraglaciecola sp.]|nr:GNAT family N-acetyltransferase [Paraglaciecola sp.]